MFFRGILPQEVGRRLDFRTPREDKTSYTDESLAEFSEEKITGLFTGNAAVRLWLLMQGIERGLEQGIGRGKQEAKREDARRMIVKGYPVEDICEITGLSREEVRGLK